METTSPFQIPSILKNLFQIKNSETQELDMARPKQFIVDNEDELDQLTLGTSGDKDIQNLREISSLAYEIGLPYFAIGFGHLQINLFPDCYNKEVISNPEFLEYVNPLSSMPPTSMIRHLICNAENKELFNRFPSQPTDDNALKFNAAIVQYGPNVNYLSLIEIETIQYFLNVVPELIQHFPNVAHIYFKGFCPEIDFDNIFEKYVQFLSKLPNPNGVKIIELIDYQIPKIPGKLNEMTELLLAQCQNVTEIYFTGNLRIEPNQVENIINRDPKVQFESINPLSTKLRTNFTIQGFRKDQMELFDKLMENIAPFVKSNPLTIRSSLDKKKIRNHLFKCNWKFCKRVKLMGPNMFSDKKPVYIRL